MMTKDFEKYFSLPWETTKEKDIVFIKGQDWDIPVVIAEGSIAECAEREALQYAVQCANLMPEAVEILKDLIIATTSNDRSPDGLDYTEDVIQRAEALLTKLEGGETA